MLTIILYKYDKATKGVAYVLIFIELKSVYKGLINRDSIIISSYTLRIDTTIITKSITKYKVLFSVINYTYNYLTISFILLSLIKENLYKITLISIIESVIYKRTVDLSLDTAISSLYIRGRIINKYRLLLSLLKL